MLPHWGTLRKYLVLRKVRVEAAALGDDVDLEAKALATLSEKKALLFGEMILFSFFFCTASEYFIAVLTEYPVSAQEE